MAIFSKFKTITAIIAIATGAFITEAQAQNLSLTIYPPRTDASTVAKPGFVMKSIEAANSQASDAGHRASRLEPMLKTKFAETLSENLSLRKEDVDNCLSTLEQSKRCGNEELVSCIKLMWEALNNVASKSSENLNLLCWHLLINLANPVQINQGNHNTCALAALESYLVVKHPSIVCRVVLDAWNQNFVLPDGRKIQINEGNLRPDKEALYYRPEGNYRSYASQIFQIAAANAYWQSQNIDPRGNRVPPGSIRYIEDYAYQLNNRKDTGERLLIFWEDNMVEQVTGEDGLFPASSPCFNIEAIDETYKLITHMNDAPVLLAHKSKRSSKPVLSFSNETSLKKILSDLKSRNALPAIISLNMKSSALNPQKGLLVAINNKLVFANTQRQLTGWHVLCVNDYDEKTDAAAIDNFWGSSSDYLENKLDLSELWSSSLAQMPSQSPKPPIQLADQN